MENNYEKIADELLQKARHGDKKSFHELEELAADGNARALSNLAQIYLKGFGIVENSYKKAVMLFQKAAALNEVYALFRLGEFYRDAKCGFEQDGHKAAECFIQAAEHATANGAAKCLRLAAEIYHYGKGGVTPDGYKAIELYKKLDDKRALMNIAQIYTEGCGSLQADGLKAVEYLNKAAERGDERSAFYALANLYRYGKGGLKVDGYKVIEYLAKLDDLKGIAEIYRDGKYNVKSDGHKAIEYLIKKVERDKGKTLDEIADRYLKKNRGHDMNDANEYLDALNELCNIDTFQEIAENYFKLGDGQKALEYFFKASAVLDNAVRFTKKFIEQNSDIKQTRPKVCSLIFRWCERRNKKINQKIADIRSEDKADIRPDDHKAIDYSYNLTRAEAFRNAAENYFKLGDGQKALEYFLKADECGDAWAFIEVARIYREGRGNLKPDGIKLIEYLTKKIEQDDFFAECITCDIAEAYEEGCGSLEPNMQKAIEFYKKSAGLGNNFAETKLAELLGSCD